MGIFPEAFEIPGSGLQSVLGATWKCDPGLGVLGDLGGSIRTQEVPLGTHSCFSFVFLPNTF